MPAMTQQLFACNPAYEDRLTERLAQISPWLACSMIVRVHAEHRLETESARFLLRLHQERLARQMAYQEAIIRCRDDAEASVPRQKYGEELDD